MLSRGAVWSLKSPRSWRRHVSLCPNLQRLDHRSHLVWYSQRTALAAVGLGVFWFADKELNASAVARNLRTLWAVSPLTSP